MDLLLLANDSTVTLRPLFAYIDPAGGLLALQGAIAAVVGAMTVLRRPIRRFAERVVDLFRRTRDERPGDAHNS